MNVYNPTLPISLHLIRYERLLKSTNVILPLISISFVCAVGVTILDISGSDLPN